MTIQTLVNQWFLDPISGKPFSEPVTNQCGHSYSKRSLEKWNEKEKKNECPLCRAPIQMLIKNVLFEQAVAYVSDESNKNFTSTNQFTDEERGVVESAIQAISQQQTRDASASIPTRLTPYFSEGINLVHVSTAYSRQVSSNKGCF